MGYKTGRIYNKQNGVVLFYKGVRPTGFWARFRGLQWRDKLNTDQAWWFSKCNFVHTFGMRFNLDIIHVSTEGMIVKINESVAKRRLSFAQKGSSVVEVQAGLTSRLGLKCGDFLGWYDE